MMNLRRGLAAPPIIKILVIAFAPFVRGRHVADRSIEPHVPIVPLLIRDLKPEIRRGSGHVPVSQRFSKKMSFEIISDLRLQMRTILSPLIQEDMQLLEFDKKMFGRAYIRDSS